MRTYWQFWQIANDLSEVYLELGETQKLIKMIRELHKTCQTADGSDDVSKARRWLRGAAAGEEGVNLGKFHRDVEPFRRFSIS